MANTRSTPRPKPAVPKRKAFDLDALEREDAPEPYAALVSGKEYVFGDPLEFDWQDAVRLDETNVHDLLRKCLDDQYDAFVKHSLPMWKLRALVADLQQHYGIIAPEKDDASSTS